MEEEEDYQKLFAMSFWIVAVESLAVGYSLPIVHAHIHSLWQFLQRQGTESIPFVLLARERRRAVEVIAVALVPWNIETNKNMVSTQVNLSFSNTRRM